MLISNTTLLYLFTVLICSLGGKKPYKPSHNELVDILAGKADAPPSAKLSTQRHSNTSPDANHFDRSRSQSGIYTSSRGPLDQILALKASAESAKHSNLDAYQSRKKKALQLNQLSKQENAMELILGSAYYGHDRCRFIGTSPFRIVVFVDRAYIKLVKNWLLYYVSVCGTDAIDATPSTLEIVCMDSVIPKLILDMGLNCSRFSFVLNYTKSSIEQHEIRSKVWTQRVIAMQQILQYNKTSILISDLDALWLHDPFPVINQHYTTSSQLIASRGLWPETVSATWGATLCMGFMFIKSSEFSIDLLGEMKAQLINSKLSKTEYSSGGKKKSSHLVRKSVVGETNKNTKPPLLIDDQYWLNTILQTWKLQWKSTRLPLLINGSVAVDIGKVFRLGNVHTIALLPHANFVRHCLPNPLHGNYSDRIGNLRYVQALVNKDEVMILHCLGISGSAMRKNMFFVDFDLWRLANGDIRKTPVIY